jgi:hypothetical protein
MQARKRIAVAAACSFVLAPIAGVDASARPGWSPVTMMSGFSPLPTDPALAVSPRGDGLLAAVTPRFGAPGTLKVSVRPAGGAFAAPVPLSTPGNDAIGFGVALARSGGAIAVWDEGDAGTGERSVRFATRRAGGTFSAPVSLGAGENPRVGVSAAGEAVIVWTTTDADGIVGDVVAVLAPGAPAPGPVTALHDASGFPASDAVLAVGGDGTAVVAFRGGDGTVQASLRPPGGEFGAPAVLSDPNAFQSGSESEGPPAVAADDHGGAMVVWDRRTFASPEAADQPAAVQAATRAPGGPLVARGDVAPVRAPASDPALAADDAGQMTVVWRERKGVLAVTVPPGEGFGAPVPVARDPTTDEQLKVPVALAVAPDGTTTVGLDGDRFPQPGVVLATVRPAGAGAGAFGPVCTVASNGGGPTIAAGSAGEIVAAWTEVSGSDEEMFTSSYQAQGRTHCAEGPLISSLELRPTTFAASRRGPSVGHRGAHVRIVLNRAARVTWTVQRLGAVAGRWVTLRGRFQRRAGAGRSSFQFTGRIGGRTLAPKYYRLVAVPRAGGMKGEAATVEFQIQRR